MASTNCEPLSCEELQYKSEAAQQQFGDCLPTDTVVLLPKEGQLRYTQIDLVDLSNVWCTWSPSRQQQFNQKYGHIGHLINVQVDMELIEAMSQFWDPFYRHFIFNTVDMTPTIEEYATLLNLSFSTPVKVYQHEQKFGFIEKFAKIMGVQVEEIDHLKRRKQCVHCDSLFDFIQKHPDDDKGMSMMALAIYGLVVFPRSPGHVDFEVVSFFDQVENGVNPVPAILAETFRSLNVYRAKGAARFQGCTQLLYIWIKSHLECYDSRFAEKGKDGNCPIAEFLSSTWPGPFSKEVWVETFRHLNIESVIWKAPWMSNGYMLYKCGKYPWVPLLGPWGGISYAPATVMRQLGSKQFIPVTHGLNRLEFSYQSDGVMQTVKEVAKAWEQPYHVKLGKHEVSTTEGYPAWHIRRGRGSFSLTAHNFESSGDYHKRKKSEDEFVPRNITSTLKDKKLQSDCLELNNPIMKRVEELERENTLLIDRVDALVRGSKALQTDLNFRTFERDEAEKRNHILQTSVNNSNYQILLQHNEIQKLMAECKRLKTGRYYRSSP